MLAPRKTLHSTPLSVFRQALDIVDATTNDVLYDIGCGDGRCVVDASLRLGIRSVGIEIDEKRAQVAREAASDAQVGHLVTILGGNALDFDYDDATIVFLFLIERGLRLILPKLLHRKKPCRVISYLYKFPDVAFVSRHMVQAKETIEDVAFPIFVYNFPLSSQTDTRA